MRIVNGLILVLGLFCATNSFGLSRNLHDNQVLMEPGKLSKFSIKVAHNIKVTHIKFDYLGGNENKSDALNIRQKFGKNNDLSHKGNGVGSGEWNYKGKNEPALYVANQKVKIKVRLVADPSAIQWADIEANAVSGLLRNVVMRPVQFVNGISHPEYVTFELDGPTRSRIEKIIDSWQWKASNIKRQGAAIKRSYRSGDPTEKTFSKNKLLQSNNINKSGSVLKDITLSGPHTVYTVLDLPKAPWYQNDDNHHPWMSALDFAIVAAGTNGMTNIGEAADAITDFIYSNHGLIYSSKDMGGSKYFRFKKLKKQASPVRGIFSLTNFIQRRSNFANCQDTTAAVQTLINLVGGDSQFAHRTKFGYLNTIKLIGVGKSNNPFFNHSGIASQKVVGKDDLWFDANKDGFRDRTYFKFHTYVLLRGKVYDATLGPYKRLSEDAYIAAVIDKSIKAEADKAKGSKIFGIPLGLE